MPDIKKYQQSLGIDAEWCHRCRLIWRKLKRWRLGQSWGGRRYFRKIVVGVKAGVGKLQK